MEFRYRPSKSLPLILALLLCSCVDTPGYPTQWAGPIHGNVCQSIAGTYSDKGEAGDPAKQAQWSLRLSSFILDIPDVQDTPMSREHLIRRTDRVQITMGTDDAMTAQLMSGSEILKSLHFSKADSTLKCGKDGLIINSYSGLGRTGSPIAGFEHDDISLSKAADGSLVVRYYSTTSGLVFMLPLPVSATQAQWSRFPVWKPSDKKS